LSLLSHLSSLPPPPFHPFSPLASGDLLSSPMASSASSSYSAISSYSSDESWSDMPKNAVYYLPPIVRALGEDVIVNKVRLQCKAMTDGRYLYTYSMDLAQDHPNLRTESSIDLIDEISRKSITSRSNQSKKSCSTTKDSLTDYSVKSFHVRRPEPAPLPPQTSITVQEKALSPSSPNGNAMSLTNMTIRSAADEYSAEIRREITVTFYLFGQTERGDYFRLRFFDAFLAKASIRRVLTAFATATDHSFKDFIDHLYVLPGSGEHLKNATKWQKMTRDQISVPIGELHFNKKPFSDEFVIIADLIGVHEMSPAVRRSIKQK
ncbi:hypothetical protein PENTCL1PPCAC_11827, partial [Pristionchus entomophagus]